MKNILLVAFILFSRLYCSGQKLDNKTWKESNDHLPFWDSTIGHAGEQGYIDTFTIDHTPFRIIHNDTLFDGTVQVYHKNKWVNNIEFENLGNHNDYDITNDLDRDGNNDLIFYWKWFGEIYFFDKKTRCFSDSSDCSMSIDWDLLDSSKNIYYESDFGKLMHSPVQSNLFTFQNKKRIEIASLVMYFNTDYNSENNGNLTRCVLYLSGHKKPYESFTITGKIAPYEYDLVKYWKNLLTKINLSTLYRK